MRRLLVGLLLLAACRPRMQVPALDAFPAGPLWPPPPDTPRVAWVGEIRPPSGRFARPIDVACGQGHVLAVADTDASAVWVIEADDGRWFRVQEADWLPFSSPVGVAFDGAGGLLVVDSERASVFRGRGDKKGRFKVWVGPPAFQRPTAIAPRPDGSALVVDAGAHGLVHVSADGAATPEVGRRGGAGRGFNFPVDLAVGPRGEIYVADSLNALVQRAGPDGPIPVAGGPGDGGDRMIRPKGVAVDREGRVHVVDAGMQHVQVYDGAGRLLGRYGEPGSGPGQLGLPAGLCIDADDHVFVADSLNGRVQVYQLLGVEG